MSDWCQLGIRGRSRSARGLDVLRCKTPWMLCKEIDWAVGLQTDPGADGRGDRALSCDAAPCEFQGGVAGTVGGFAEGLREGKAEATSLVVEDSAVIDRRRRCAASLGPSGAPGTRKRRQKPYPLLMIPPTPGQSGFAQRELGLPDVPLLPGTIFFACEIRAEDRSRASTPAPSPTLPRAASTTRPS